jgi:hypothetical protein
MEIRRRINKDRWLLKIVTPKEMRKLSGSNDTAGLCVPDDHAIYISDDSVTYRVIAHELFHAFWSYLHLKDTNNINLDDAEEIGASLFAGEGEEMVKKAKRFTKTLKKLQEKEK